MCADKNLIIAHDLETKERSKDVLTENNLTFNNLMLSPSVLNGLNNCGYRKPSPIQQKAIPIGKCGFGMTIKQLISI